MAFPTGWSYKRQISIASGQKSGSPTGIVLTITESSGLADANGPLDADGTAPAQNGGGDLRVSSDSAGINQIPLDVVSFVTDNDHTAATCELKVNFDDLSGDSLYLWWGTAGTESQPAVTDTYGRNAVYSSGNHVLAYSMDEDPSGSAPQITDRTGNGNNGTSAGSMTSGDVVAGQLGSAIDLDGSDDYVDAGSATNLTNAFRDTNLWSISGWFKSSSSTGDIVGVIESAGSAEGSGNDYIRVHLSGGNLRFAFDTFNDATVVTTGSAVNDGSWHRFSAVRTAAKSGQLFVDGASVGTDTSASGGSGIDVPTQIDIGRFANNSPQLLSGTVDSITVYSRAITAADDATLYNCEANNAAFWSVGSVESVGGGGGFGAYLAAASRSSRTLCGSRL